MCELLELLKLHPIKRPRLDSFSLFALSNQHQCIHMFARAVGAKPQLSAAGLAEPPALTNALVAPTLCHKHHQLTCSHVSPHSRQPSEAQRCFQRILGLTFGPESRNSYVEHVDRNFPLHPRSAWLAELLSKLGNKARSQEVRIYLCKT